MVEAEAARRRRRRRRRRRAVAAAAAAARRLLPSRHLCAAVAHTTAAPRHSPRRTLERTASIDAHTPRQSVARESRGSCQLVSAYVSGKNSALPGGPDAILSSETRSIMITKRIVNDALRAKTSHPSQAVWSPESASFNGRGCANSNDHTSTMCEHGGRWVGAVIER